MVSRTTEQGTEQRNAIGAAALGGMLVVAALLAALAAGWMQAVGPQAAAQTIGGMAPTAVRQALQEQARLMGLPLAEGSQAYWYLARAGGIMAYLLLWLATCWGVMMSSKVIKGVVSTPLAYALHEYLPLLAVVFAALHALVLLGDSYIGFTLWQVVVPFSSPYEPLWTGLGSLAFYLSLALIGSFYVRKRIGQKTWRAFHYLAYVAFLLALVHGLMAGSDSGSPALRGMYLVTGGVSLFLVYYRALAHSPRRAVR